MYKKNDFLKCEKVLISSNYIVIADMCRNPTELLRHINTNNLNVKFLVYSARNTTRKFAKQKTLAKSRLITKYIFCQISAIQEGTRHEKRATSLNRRHMLGVHLIKKLSQLHNFCYLGPGLSRGYNSRYKYARKFYSEHDHWLNLSTNILIILVTVFTVGRGTKVGSHVEGQLHIVLKFLTCVNPSYILGFIRTKV